MDDPSTFYTPLRMSRPFSPGAAAGGPSLISAGAADVQANWSSGTTVVLTYNGLTVGRSLLIGWAIGDGVTFSSIAMAGGNTVTLRGSEVYQPTTINARLQFATVNSIVTGGNLDITLTMGGTPTWTNLWAAEYQNCDTSNCFDAAAGQAINDGANPNVDLTTVQDNAHIVSIMTNSVNSATVGSGYTLTNFVNGGGWYNRGEQDTDFDAGLAGTKNVNYVCTSSDYAIQAISLRHA